MNKLLTILLIFVFVAASNAFYTEGLFATASDYMHVVVNAKLIEYVLGILLAISFTNLLENQTWFRSTYSLGRSDRLAINEAGEREVVSSEYFSSTPDHDNARRAAFYSAAAFVFTLAGTAMASFIIWCDRRISMIDKITNS